MSVRVTALGSGDAFCAAGRGHTCWLIEASDAPAAAAGGDVALVDAGATALAALWRLGVDPQRIASVHFTHLHGDHIAGWPFLLIDAHHRARRTRPLFASGPPGTRERLQKLFEACYADAAGRPLPFELRVDELAPGESASAPALRVTALRAQHMRAPHVALSLRVEAGGRLLAFTGDTGPHDGLPALARDADALFAECTDLRAPADGAPEPRTSADYPREAGRRHLAWDDLRVLLPRLGVRRVALAHLSAEVRAAKRQLEDEARALGLSLTVCDDLDAIEV
jgi:ribonuclease BN (tRNA processing enzyme)